MTLTGRNRLLRITFVAALVFYTIILSFFFVSFIGGSEGPPEITPMIARSAWQSAAAAAIVTGALGLAASLLFLRLFRRTPSVAVFFVTLFFICMVLDTTKLLQLMLPQTEWIAWSAAISRLTMFGHIAGTAALFGAGLFAGGIRMQRHGTALVIALIATAGLSAAIPIQTGALPVYLVYQEGMRASLRASLFVLLVVSVVNYIYAAVSAEVWRRLWGAVAVALIAIGREILFYRADPLWIALGAGSFAAGVIVFASQNYSEFVVS